MSESQAAPQTATTQQTPQTTETAQSQGSGAQGAVGGQAGNPISEAAKEAIRKHKLKVDGQEIEVDDEELKRGYGLQKVSTKRMQEGLAAKKQAEEFISMMKDKGKLFNAIQKLGHDPRKVAEEYLAEQLRDEMMDPREKELRDTKAELKRLQSLDEEQKKALEDKRIAVLRDKFSKDYNDQFVEALKASSLPPTKETVAEMAKYISRAAHIGFKMTAEEAAKLVKEDIEERHRRLYGEADPETLVRLLGDQGLQKIRQYDTSRLKNPEENLKTPQDQGELGQRKRNPTKRMTPAEWREFNRK
jgi:hypothetical protein